MNEFIEITPVFNTYAQYLAFILYGLSVLMLLAYVGKLISTKDYKDKYDFINKSEINVLWYFTIVFIVATSILINTLALEITILWFLVKLFLTIMMAIISGVIIQNILKFYYPFYIEKRLKKLRYKPRISPKSGKPMELLSEDEEDVYLDEGMQAEEDLFSIDYDVWIDKQNNYTKVEKYFGYLHAEQCPECNYQTFQVMKEELVKLSTVNEAGELIKHYNCVYCGHKASSTFKVAKIKD